MKYTWQHPNWPNYIYDESQSQNTQYQYALEAGRLSGGLGQLSNSEQYDAYIDLMVSEAINTSKIEGEKLDSEEVRSSIKNFLGLSNPAKRVLDPRAEGVGALMVDVRKTFKEPLTKDRLFHWHKLLLPDQDNQYLLRNIQVGQWRNAKEPMQIVSGPIGYEIVHYEAPPSNKVDEEMDRYLAWYNETSPLNSRTNNTLSGPARSAIAHLWFETIHPFDDGNGRIGRAIAEQALAQDLGRPSLLSLSTTIEKDKKAYYDNLNKASQTDLNITPWVNWFTETILKSQKAAILNIEFVLNKAKFWEAHHESELNKRQIKVIRKVFEVGPEGFAHGINSRKYMSMTSCSKATANRDLSALVEEGCLYQIEGAGRSSRYALKLDSLDAPIFSKKE